MRDEPFHFDEAWARAEDEADALAPLRDEFVIPRSAGGTPKSYFCGNSLGLQPVAARAAVDVEMSDWATLAVDAHFDGRNPWFSYHERFRESCARLVGADPEEVVVMNGLTANLHLMMVSFYRPDGDRDRVLVEDTAFPSDTYAVRSQLRHHGLDPDEALVVARPRPGEHVVRTEDVEALIEEHRERLALVLMGGVQYYTGQWFDMPRITAAGQAAGAVVGFDLAHAAGNVPMAVHDWGVDFAVWCSYKYLNGGPGAIAGCFVHGRHGRDRALPRFAGWWGNDPATRFRMHLEPEFVPRDGADGWQLSNPPILAMAPLRASLDLFDRAGMEALRAKSVRLTGYLEYLLDRIPSDDISILTPRDEAARGCQLSIRVHQDDPERLVRSLQVAGHVVDFRPPDVIRAAPVPLYNTYSEVRRFASDFQRGAGQA